MATRFPVRRAAFFDLDNTLLHGSSLYLLGSALHAHGLVSTSEVLRGAWQQLLFRLAGERTADIARIRDRSLALGAGVEVAPLIALAENIYDERISGRLLPQTLALVRAHLDRGDDVWIVTAAPVELATIVATRLGLAGALGSVSEVIDGRWSGRLVGELLHGPAKAAAVHGLAADRGYDLAGCAAYSDSVNDLPLLDLVGFPHAVNPDRRLVAVAGTRGWPVHEFRLRRHGRISAVAAAAVAATTGATLYAMTRGDSLPRVASVTSRAA